MRKVFVLLAVVMVLLVIVFSVPEQAMADPMPKNPGIKFVWEEEACTYLGDTYPYQDPMDFKLEIWLETDTHRNAFDVAYIAFKVESYEMYSASQIGEMDNWEATVLSAYTPWPPHGKTYQEGGDTWVYNYRTVQYDCVPDPDRNYGCRQFWMYYIEYPPTGTLENPDLVIPNGHLGDLYVDCAFWDGDSHEMLPGGYLDVMVYYAENIFGQDVTSLVVKNIENPYLTVIDDSE